MILNEVSPRFHVSVDHITSFNSLWPSDTIWRHRTWSTLAQVMACCLSAPGHYLNQCWLIISKIQSYSSWYHFTKDTSAINQWNQFANYLSKFPFKSPRDQWFKWPMRYHEILHHLELLSPLIVSSSWMYVMMGLKYWKIEICRI